ncbi:XRE family transcriptional regulator [Parashewanella spongiae]|uniref:XRE family transcriptional regulator n=1 Tax=Parashewanella spongiae TaxID=342950 RepID=A0A3A6T706_9GAMM|nr:helix-turn-helix transcriptional regulator [Parashewanella spongiae]MCL1080142.1 helix-turn-helix domain-containing protein [Parashewanella spongiae]RJY05201.1 XRE family transcriptional regulator [Parashewanella spongiae]
MEDTKPKELSTPMRKRTSKTTKGVSTFERNQKIREVIFKVVTSELTQGQALKVLRMDIIGLKQDAYAKLVKVSRKTISEIENDRGNYTAEVVNKVFKPFGLKVGLMPRSPQLLATLFTELNSE